MKHNFAKSLAIGKAGEDVFGEIWPYKFTRLGGRKADFYCEGTGCLVELKSDSYSLAKTKNFFIELVSDVERNKQGGLFEANDNNVTFLLYNFGTDRTAFVFDLRVLVLYIRANSSRYKPVLIANRSWTTMGIKVPRTDLAHLYFEVKY